MRRKLLALLALTGVITGVGVSRWRAVRDRYIALAQSSQTGPWVPLIAKQTVKVYQSSLGGRTLIQERTGSYLRNRAGSIYQRTLSVMGPQVDSTAHLQDIETGKAYQIDYKSKTVTAIGEGVTAPRQPVPADEFRQQFASAQWLGKKAISGVECEGYKIPPNDGGATEGQLWVAASLNFLPIQNKIIDHLHYGEVLVTLEDIHAGVDPDPELLQIPEGFTVVDTPAPSGR